MQYISNLFSSCTRESKTRAAQFTKLRNCPTNNSHSEKRMKAHVFPSSTVYFKSMLFFFSLLLDINFCFELEKVRKNLQQNFEALFHIWKASLTDDFVRSKSRRKNQGKKICQESYCKLILVCTSNI